MKSSTLIVKRASTVAELRERSGTVASEESVRAALSFRPWPRDVLIATYPKCGTTWIQQIVHGLRTRGSMDFDEITAVVPWLELALDLGINLEAPHAAPPRAFKTHLSWRDIPKGARYISAVRDPKDVLVSAYHFAEGWRFEPGAISMAIFAREFYLARPKGRRYWDYVASWWEQRGRDDVLLLCFEEMKADLPSAVRDIAGFIGCPLDDELLEIVVRQSSIEFMQAHNSQFDDHLVRRVRNASRGLPPGGESSKVRAGRVGDHRRELPEELGAELERIWKREMEAQFGLASYGEMRARLAAERARARDIAEGRIISA